MSFFDYRIHIFFFIIFAITGFVFDNILLSMLFYFIAFFIVEITSCYERRLNVD